MWKKLWHSGNVLHMLSIKPALSLVLYLWCILIVNAFIRQHSNANQGCSISKNFKTGSAKKRSSAAAKIPASSVGETWKTKTL